MDRIKRILRAYVRSKKITPYKTLAILAGLCLLLVFGLKVRQSPVEVRELRLSAVDTLSKADWYQRRELIFGTNCPVPEHVPDCKGAIADLDRPWKEPDPRLLLDPFNGTCSRGECEEEQIKAMLHGLSTEYVLEDNRWWEGRTDTVIGKIGPEGVLTTSSKLMPNSSFSAGVHLPDRKCWYLVGRDGLQLYKETDNTRNLIPLPRQIDFSEWIHGITYDTKRDRLILLAPFDADNKTRLYAYYPRTKTWTVLCAIPNCNAHVKGLVYAAEEDTYYALARLYDSKDDGRHTFVYAISPDGFLTKAREISCNLCGSEQWFDAKITLTLHNEYLVVTMLGAAHDPMPPRVCVLQRDNGRFKHMFALDY
ncbi:MAG: hypothetical protein K2X93_05750 [Candidatus Obscuribacterales bacterium]|nr:hypothetical protein [Candidatus Obscuribacterales bacterium]